MRRTPFRQTLPSYYTQAPWKSRISGDTTSLGAQHNALNPMERPISIVHDKRSKWLLIRPYATPSHHQPRGYPFTRCHASSVQMAVFQGVDVDKTRSISFHIYV